MQFDAYSINSRYNDENPTCANRIGLSEQMTFTGNHMSDANYTKCCRVCGIEKSLSEFHNDKTKKDGHHNICKPCKCAETREWNSENKERKLKSTLKWQRENKEARAKISKRYLDKFSREEKRNRLNEWRAKNPEANRSAIARRRKQLRTSAKHYTAEDVKRIKTAQQNKCAVCKTDVSKSFHVDHVIPVSAGGDNSPLNIQILCPTCNLNKNAKDPIDFMQSRGFLL